MPLNLSINDGDFTPYIKYNAKAGRWYIKPEGATEEVEIEKPRLAFDMANIRTGWIFYQDGAGPEKIWDPSNKQEAPRPPGTKKFKRGFEVAVYGNDPIPGIGKIGLREFSSTAANCIAAVVAMYNEYEAGMKAHPNEVPFYACLGVKPIQGAFGTNYEPQFILKGWVARSKIPEFTAAPTPAIDWDQVPGEPRPVAPKTNGGVRFIPNARDDARANGTENNPPARVPFDEERGDEIPF